MNYVSKLKNSKAGFTLIELLITIGIIGILAAIAIPQYSSYKRLGYRAMLISDTKNAYTASVGHIANGGSVGTLDEAALVAVGFVKSDSAIVITTDVTGAPNYTITLVGDTAWGLAQNTAVIDQNGLMTFS